MIHTIKFTITMAILCSFFTGNAIAADPLALFPRPRIIRTHNRQGAVVFWDATAYIERFASLGTSKETALTLLEFEAFKIFESEAHALSSADHHLSVVAAFAKTGAMNPRYQTKNFEGVQNLLTLDGNVYKQMKFGKDADRRAQLGIFPPWLKLRIASHVLDESE